MPYQTLNLKQAATEIVAFLSEKNAIVRQTGYWQMVTRNALLSTGIAFGMAVLFFQWLPEASENDLGMIELILMIVVSPLFETMFLLVPCYALTRLFTQTTLAIALAVAFLCASLHSFLVPIWGVVIFPSFVIFTCLFLMGKQHSWLRGCLGATMAHSIQNSLAALGMVIG